MKNIRSFFFKELKLLLLSAKDTSTDDGIQAGPIGVWDGVGVANDLGNFGGGGIRIE